MKVKHQKTAPLFKRLFVYVFLLVIGFIYLYPVLKIVSNSGMDMLDLYDPGVRWLPRTFHFENYPLALEALGGSKILIRTILIMGCVALAQTMSAAVIGYGFAKATFRGSKVLFLIMIATFFVPQYIMMIPRYVQYYSYGWLGTLKTLLIPALTGQGTKHAVFILIFYQFFKMTPKALDEAAALDGAGNFRIFAQINLRMAVPAAITVFVLSLVWNWNEVELNRTYLGSDLKPLAVAMQDIQNVPGLSMYGDEMSTAMEQAFHLGRQSAAIMISIIPLILVYILFEKYIVAGIDMSGITGE